MARLRVSWSSQEGVDKRPNFILFSKALKPEQFYKPMKQDKDDKALQVNRLRFP